jgi:hypothetical protein
MSLLTTLGGPDEPPADGGAQRLFEASDCWV